MYNGVVEASRVPPEWDGWLHYTTDVVPPAGGQPRKPWQKDHEPNFTGTDHAYRPPGHTLVIGDKPKPPYEAWRPGSAATALGDRRGSPYRRDDRGPPGPLADRRPLPLC